MDEKIIKKGKNMLSQLDGRVRFHLWVFIDFMF